MSACPDPKRAGVGHIRLVLLCAALPLTLSQGGCPAPDPQEIGSRQQWRSALSAMPAGEVHRLVLLEGVLTPALRAHLERQQIRVQVRLGGGWLLCSGPQAALEALPVGRDEVTRVRRRGAVEKLGPRLRTALALDTNEEQTLWVLLSERARSGDTGPSPAAALLQSESAAREVKRVGFAPIFQLKGVPPHRALHLAALDPVRHVALAPGPAVPLLDESRVAIGVEPLQAINTSTTPPSYTLSGKGRFAGIWDPHGVEASHDDLKDNLVRSADPTIPPSLSHGTAVGSCLGGTGARSSTGGNPWDPFRLRGMAPEVKLAMWVTSDDTDASGKQTTFIEQYLEARKTYDVDVLSFSFSHSDHATYSATAANLDFVVARSSPALPSPVPISVAAGNEAWTYGYGSITGFASAKNVLSLGGTDWATGMRYAASSFGPTTDGRLKPEVMAPGCSSHGKTKVGIDSVKVIPSAGAAKVWTFDGGTAEGFTVVRHLDALVVTGGVLEATTSGDDPGVYTPDALNLDPTIYTKVEISMRADHHHRAELFWKTDKAGWSGKRRQEFFINADGKLHTYTIDLSGDADWKDTIVQLRIDPVTTGIMLARPGNSYSTSCGTSMSTPIAAGGVVLLRQAWAAALPQAADPSPALLKALLVATARDMVGQGPDQNPDLNGAPTPYWPGPDHATGYGEIQVDRAVALIQQTGKGQRGLIEGTILETGRKVNLRFTLKDKPAAPISVTLAWDDPPGEPGAKVSLQNDLDLTVTPPAGKALLPWALPVGYPNQAAVKGVDRVNNVEQVQLADAAAGTYVATVEGYDLARVPQAFALVLSDLSAVEGTGIELDADGDGAYGAKDCDDADPTVHPKAQEVVGNGKDDDCEPKTSDRPQDGGAEAGADGGAEAGADGGAEEPAPDQGCSCEIGGTQRWGLSGPVGFVLILILIGGRRRRRTRRRC